MFRGKRAENYQKEGVAEHSEHRDRRAHVDDEGEAGRVVTFVLGSTAQLFSLDFLHGRLLIPEEECGRPCRRRFKEETHAA